MENIPGQPPNAPSPGFPQYAQPAPQVTWAPPPQPQSAPVGMTRGQGNLIIVSLAAIAALIFFQFIFSIARSARPATVQKWDYRIEEIEDYDFSTKMSSLGEQGWELTFARRALDSSSSSRDSKSLYECIFRKPKPDATK